MDIMDRVHSLADNALDLNSITNEPPSPAEPQGYNPIQDLANAVSEWADEAQKAGERISKAASEMYANDSSMSVLDDMTLPKTDMSSADLKLAMALEDAIEEACYDVTKDPLSIAGDVGGAVAPWIPLAVQLPIMLKEANKMTDSGKSAGEAARNLGLPMVAGTVAASVSHTLGGKLAKVAPLASKVLTTPFVGSTMAAGGTLMASPEMRKFASEHPARFAVNMFTTDTAIGAKKLATPSVDNKTHIDTPFMQEVDRLLSANENTVRSTDVSTDTGILRNKLEGVEDTTSPTDNAKGTPQRTTTVLSDGVTEVENVQPLITKVSEPRTLKEDALPENRADLQQQADLLADKTVKQKVADRDIPEVMQGAFDEPLAASTERMYPKTVSVNEIWSAFKKIVPIRVGNMGNEPSYVGGYYDLNGAGIRVRGFSVWSIMCHELGHALSRKFEFARGTEVEQELAAGARSIWKQGQYGDINTPDGFSAYVEEGRAAFMNEYLVNPTQAKKHFPLTYAAFEEAIAKDTVWSANVDLIGQKIRRWCNQSVYEKSQGRTAYEDDMTKSIADKVAQESREVRENWVDEFAPLHDIVENYNEVFHNGEALKADEDPAVLAQRAKEGMNATDRCLIDGNGFNASDIFKYLANKFNTALHAVTLVDCLTPFKVGGERGEQLKAWLKETGYKDFYNTFTDYRIALHERDVIRVKNGERLAKLKEGMLAIDEKIKKLTPILDKAVAKAKEIEETQFKPAEEKLKKAEERQQEVTTKLKETNTDITTTTHEIKELENTLKKAQDKKATLNDWHERALKHLQELIPHKIKAKNDKWIKSNLVNIDKYRQRVSTLQYDILDNKTLIEKATAELAEWKQYLDELTKLQAKLKEQNTQAGLAVKLAKEVHNRHLAELNKAKKEMSVHQKQMEKYKERRQAEWEKNGKEIQDIQAGRADYKVSKTKEEIDAVITKCEECPEFKTANELFSLWHDNIMQIAIAGGVLSKERYAELKAKYPNYIPRVRDFTIEGDNTNQGAIMRSLTAEGSERVVKDPIMQSVLDMRAVIASVERNRINRAVARLSEKPYGHYLMMKVEDGRNAKKNQIIKVYENGKPIYYQCMADGLYEALTSSNKSFVSMNLDVLSATQERIADGLRFGATGTPAFALNNAGKDVLDAVVLNADGRGKGKLKIIQPLRIVAEGISILLSTNERWQRLGLDKNIEQKKAIKAEYYAQGVQYTTRIGSRKGKITKALRRIVNPETGKVEKITGKVRKWFEYYIAFNEACEQVTRLALYKRVKDRGGTAVEAATVASDGTVNFMRSGKVARKYNRLIPFFNATIQGDSKLFREITKNPWAVSLTAFQCITLPTLAMYAFNKDEDWYRDIPVDDKNKSWYVKLNGTIVRFPKPPVLGQIFGSLIERTLDCIYENEDPTVINDTLMEAAKGLVPDRSDPLTIKSFEWMANYNFYTGRPIVDTRLGKVSPEKQYDVYTSEVAKGIGKTLGVSPKKVDNTIYGLTSSVGYAVNGLLDMALKDNSTPDKKITELTRFTYTEGGRQSRSQDIFYKNLDKLEVEDNDAKLNGKPLKENKKLKGMQESRQLAALITNGTKAKTPKKLLKKLGKLANDSDVKRGIRAIENDKELDGKTKRAKIDKLVKVRNNIYRNANKKYLNYKYIQSPE